MLEMNANRHDSSSNKPIYTNQVSSFDLKNAMRRSTFIHLYDQKVVASQVLEL
jgi:hypothetical protein